MKKLLAALAVGALLGVSIRSEAQDLFSTGEVNLLVSGNYIDQQADHWGLGAELNYFMSRFVGFGIGSHWENVDGKFIDNLFGDIYIRFPLSDRIAPYVVGTGGYAFSGDRWFGGGGGGIDLRLNKTFGIFSDVQWVVREGSQPEDGIAVRGGIRIGF